MFSDPFTEAFYGDMTMPSTANYTPTPAQIKRECERIQATWSKRERRSRGGWMYADLRPLDETAVSDDVSMSFGVAACPGLYRGQVRD